MVMDKGSVVVFPPHSAAVAELGVLVIKLLLAAQEFGSEPDKWTDVQPTTSTHTHTHAQRHTHTVNGPVTVGIITRH